MVLVWDAKVDGPGVRNPYAEFVKKYIIGRKKIVFETSSMKVSPLWNEMCEAVARLPRHNICSLYIYTTQMYSVVSELLRSSKPKYDGFVVDSKKWHGYVSSFSDGISVPAFMKKYTDGKATAPKVALIEKNVLLASRTETTDYEVFGPALDENTKKITAAAKKERACFTKQFHEEIKEYVSEGSDGYVFYAQATRVLKPAKRWSVKEWCRVIPTIRPDTWAKIFAEYVRDIDEIFDMMPSAVGATLHRGAKGVFKKNASFSSMTLSKKVAKDYVDSTTGCCVTTIRVPPGGKVIPLFGISRYPVELEVLLPRDYAF